MMLIFIVLTFNYAYASQENLIGTHINGNFFKAGETLSINIAPTNKEQYRNNQCNIEFSNKNIKNKIRVDTCEAVIINEGDLNNDGLEDFSIFSAPLNGCTYNMETYTIKNGVIKVIVPSFLVPTACESVTYSFIQNLVFKKGNSLYYLYFNPDSDNFSKSEKKIF